MCKSQERKKMHSVDCAISPPRKLVSEREFSGRVSDSIAGIPQAQGQRRY